MTGVPLRDGFEPRTAAVPPLHLLVTGGSQGARHINEAVWGALDELRKRFEEVVHVAGSQGSAGVAAHASPGYRGLTFTDDMPTLMAGADLGLSPAGVSTHAGSAPGGPPQGVRPRPLWGGPPGGEPKAVGRAAAPRRPADSRP